MAFSRYLGCPLSPGMDPGLDSTRLEADSTPLALFLRVSHKFYRRSRASPARTRRFSPRAPRREFLLFAARRAERRETMAVFAAKLKPPTDFSYFADEPSLRSWLSCAKSPLGVSRFISAPRMHQPRAIHARYTGCAFPFCKISRFPDLFLVDNNIDVIFLPQQFCEYSLSKV